MSECLGTLVGVGIGCLPRGGVEVGYDWQFLGNAWYTAVIS